MNEKYEQELDFALKLKHWGSDAGGKPPTDKNDKFKGREYYSKQRRFIADVMQVPRNPSCSPIDHETDPEAAEAAKFPVEYVTKTPQYGFEVYLERGVSSAVNARRGWLVAEWDARINDLTFRNADPRRVFLTPGYLDPWDRTLPWLIEQVPMRYSDACARWPDLKLVVDLRGSDLDYDIARYDTQNKSTGQSEPQGDMAKEGMVLMLICWSQFDGETKPEVRGKRPVDPYSYCEACGHKNTPEVAGLACPECARTNGKFGELQLAQSEEFVEDVPVFPKDRALEIVFPLQGKCVRGPWPEGPNGEQLRMPPYMLIRRSEHPTEFCGLSDTVVDAGMQTLSDQLMERMRRQVQGPSSVIGIYGDPEKAVQDAEGNPLTLSDDPIQMAYFPDPVGATSMKVIQLADVSPALFNAIGLVQEQFRADLGVTELSANSASDLQGVAGVTVDEAVKSGAVPTTHFIKRLFWGLGCFYGVISDWCRIGWQEGRWIRMQGALGAAKWQLVAGADIPNADFVFSEGPEKAAHDRKTFQDALEWYKTGLPPGSPALRMALAAAGIAPVSIELAQQIEDAEAEALEAMQKAMPAGGGPTAPDAAGMGAPGMTQSGPEAGDPAGGGLAPDDLAAMMGARGMA